MPHFEKFVHTRILGYLFLPLLILGCTIQAKITDLGSSSGLQGPQLKLVSPSSSNHKSVSATLEVSNLKSGDVVSIFYDSSCSSSSLLSTTTASSSTAQVSVRLNYQAYTFYIQIKDSSGNITSSCSSGGQTSPITYTANYLNSPGFPIGKMNTQIGGAANVALDSSGNIFVFDDLNRVQKFSSTGDFISSFGSPGTGDGQFDSQGLGGIFIDSSNYIYISEWGNNRVQKFTSDGTFVMKFGSAGTGPGQFQGPAGLAVDSTGSIYVADTGNWRVQKFNSNGVYQLHVGGSYGTANNQFRQPRSVAVDSGSNFYVTDYSGTFARIQKFNSSGTYLQTIGSYGTAAGSFQEPGHVFVDSSGNIYATDWDYSYVTKFNSSGTYQMRYGGNGSAASNLNTPYATYENPSGDLVTIDGTRVFKNFNKTTGAYISSFGGDSGTGNGQFSSPNDLAINSSNTIYVVDKDNHRVQYFNSSGVYQGQFGSSGSGNGQFSNPTRVALDSSGNVYVNDTGNSRVQIFDSTGNYLNKFGTLGVGAGQFSGLQFTQVDSSGNIYSSDSFRIQKFTSAGAYVLAFGTSAGSGNGQFASFTQKDIAIDPSGKIWVTDPGNNRIQSFNSSGVYQSQLPIYLDQIYIDSLGYIYGVSGGVFKKYDSAGNLLTTWTKSTTSYALDNYSIGGFGFSSIGEIFFSDGAYHRILKFSSTGTPLTD